MGGRERESKVEEARIDPDQRRGGERERGIRQRGAAAAEEERQMGKYMRKCRGGMGEEVTQLVGVRTRSRSASAAISKRRRTLPPAPPTPRPGDSSLGTLGESGSCYLKLRSRMLFMAPPPAPSPAARAEAAAGGNQGAVLAGEISHCSSTASSADASDSLEKGLLCHPEASKADGDHIPEGSVTNSESGRVDRERRETTPSSHLPGEVSDLESDLAGQDRSRPLPAIRQQPATATVPLAAEIEEFFAAAEEAEAKRFAAKYNFDVARGVPLDGAGRFEWTPAVSSS